MKKTLILLFLFTSICNLKAQSFQVLDTANTDVSGDTLNFFTTPGILMNSSLSVKNNSSGAKTIRCKRRFISGVFPSDTVFFIWASVFYPINQSQVFSPVMNASIGAGAIFNNQNGFGLVAYFRATNMSGIRIISYTFYDYNNVNDSVSVFLRYHTSVAGYNEIADTPVQLSEPYPNPSTNESLINYNFSSPVQTASLQIFNASGALVKEFKLEELKGKIIINTSELAGGLYFCKLMVNSKAIETKKLVIAR